MPGEIIYSSAPEIRSPGQFVGALKADLRVSSGPAWRIFLRDYHARYRQARLGYASLLVPPLVVTLTWVYVNHVGVFHVGDTQIPYVAYVLAGTLLWQLFMDALTGPLNQLSAARESLKKTRLPHEAWILAGVLNALLGFTIRLVLLIPVLIVAGTPLSWTVVFVPVGIVTILVAGTAIGTLVTPAGLLYGDVRQGLVVIASFWFFVTPIVYARPEHGASAVLIELNPLTPLIDATRGWLTGGSASQLGVVVAILAASAVVLMVAWIIYRLARPHLVAIL